LLKSQSWIQLLSTLITNNWLTRQFTKGIPCIGFNCYACPLAAVACPIGSIQYFVGLGQVPWYVLGVVGLVGALGGRLACGWLCPFGWFQELLYKLPVPKWMVQPRDRAKGWLVLAVTLGYAAGFWLMLPFAIASTVLFALYLIAGLALYAFLGLSRVFALGGLVLVVAWITHEPWFCKICPAGMLEGGIPQVLLDAELRLWIGPLYWLKFVTLALFVAWMAVTQRPFCRWVCPLGTFWSLFNRWSTLRLAVDNNACIQCDRCWGVCPVQIRIYHDANTGSCVRCMRCIDVCPVSCIGVDGGTEEGISDPIGC
jgi:polyferredoxin